MEIITTTDELAAFCAEAQAAEYVTVDTEFLRERTYWARLCLIQMALPGPAGPEGGRAVLIDPIEGPEMSLDPIYALFLDTSTVKVFHAARQDLEIFQTEGGVLPDPLFDTQIAAMVCGFGEQVGYETLVRKVARAPLDKTSRFTDWSRRPLSDAQKAYALADVTHLRVIYEKLSQRIAGEGRAGWVAEELSVLTDPATYTVDPAEAWRRIRTRNSAPRFLGIVRELARFREDYAQARNIPRTRVMKDDALLELASMKPQNAEELGKARLLLRDARKGDIAAGILAAVRAGIDAAQDTLPRADQARGGDPAQLDAALADLLRVLLKARAQETDVAARLIASSADLDALAAGERDVPALRGWRSEVFGADALRLCDGEIGLAAQNGAVRVVVL